MRLEWAGKLKLVLIQLNNPCPVTNKLSATNKALLNTLGTEDTDVRHLHTSQFMLPVSSARDVRNYFNIWSGPVTFSATKINFVFTELFVLLSKNGIC
jgi:hypothetical protein